MNNFFSGGQPYAACAAILLATVLWLTAACTPKVAATQSVVPDASPEQPLEDRWADFPSFSKPATDSKEFQAALPEPASVVRSLEHISFFQGRDGEVGIRLEATQEIAWQPLPARPGQLRVVLPGISSPASLTKLYQLHEFDHAIKTAMVRNTPRGLELMVTATGPVRLSDERGGNSLVLRFHDLSDSDASERSADSGLPAQSKDAQTQALGILDDQALFPGMKEEYVGDPITIDLQNAEVEHVLRLIGEVAGYNLILDPEVSGRISMKLEGVPWDQVLDLVLVQKNLGMVVRGNILRISTIQRLETEREQLRRAREASMQAQETIQRLEPLQTAYIQINYATAAEMDPRTRPFLSERGRISVDPRTNTLIITDTPLHIRQIQGMIDRLDRPERQVLIEARVVYATDDFQRGIGIRWGGGIEGITTEYWRGLYGAANTPTINNQGGVSQTGYLVNAPNPIASTFGIGGFISKLIGPDMFTLDAQLQLGELKNLAKTVSAPRVVTLNNQRAEIEQGTRLAIQVPDERGTRTDYVDAVLKLSVLPQITPDNKLILDLEIRDDNQAPGGGQDVETKTTKTRLMVDDGQTLVLGGVLKAMEERLENRVPGLADIPALGWLFKNRHTRARNQELLIFIRPSIL